MYSQSCRIACCQQERSPETVPATGSIHSRWRFFRPAGIVPVKAGNGSTGSFVNRAAMPQWLTHHVNGSYHLLMNATSSQLIVLHHHLCNNNLLGSTIIVGAGVVLFF